MSESVERYALARRGLPLPTSRQATLKGAWLPSAVRNGDAPRGSRASVVATEPAAPAVNDDEPWWMEASELVPVAASSTPASAPHAETAPPMLVQEVDRRAESAPGTDTAPPMLVREVERRDVAVPSEMGRFQAPEAFRLQSHGLPTTPLASAPSAGPADGLRARPVRGQPAPTVVTNSMSASTRVASVARGEPREGHRDRETTSAVPVTPGKPEIKILTLGIVGASAERGRDARLEPPQNRTVILVGEAEDDTSVRMAPVEPSRSESGETAPTSIVEVMGVPTATGIATTPPAGADLTPLVAPARPSRGEIHIERVAVTVKAPGNPSAAPSAPAPSSRPAAPAGTARSYRNPWASYFTRRD